MRAPVAALLRSLPAAGAAVAVVLGLVACSPAEPAEKARPAPARDVRTELAGQEVRLNLPAGDGPPKGLALWFHGQSGDADDRIDGPFFSALRDDGWAVASSDFHLQSWGNSASTADTRRLLRWAEEQTGTTAVLWVAGSMGGAVSVNAMTHGVTPPACYYGIKPALSLTEMQRVPGGPQFIRQAFGGKVPRNRIPVDNLGRLPLDTRWRIVASFQDDWVPINDNGGALAYSLSQRGADVTYLKARGPHEDPSHFDTEDLLAFADSCVDPGTDPGDVAAD